MENIVNYDFYNESNILIIRNEINKDVITKFLDRPYKELRINYTKSTIYPIGLNSFFLVVYLVNIKVRRKT